MNSVTNPYVPVRIEDLGLAFGDTEVLRDINLEIEPGEFFFLSRPVRFG